MSAIAQSVTSYRDTEGYAQPTGFRGPLAVKHAKILFSDSGSKTAFKLPAGALVVQWRVIVTTAFNAATTNQLDVGITGDTTKWASNLNVGSAGIFNEASSGADITESHAILTAETDVLLEYSQSGTAATAGAAILEVVYAVFDDGYSVPSVS